MDIKRYTYTVLIPLIIATCLVSSCEKIPTQMITAAPITKVAVATISEMEGSGLTGTATVTEVNEAIHVIIEIQTSM